MTKIQEIEKNMKEINSTDLFSEHDEWNYS